LKLESLHFMLKPPAERSSFIHDEVVGVSDAIEKWAGKGTETVKKDGRAPEPSSISNDYSPTGHIPLDFWSETYQWLPANLAFQDDGTVKFTSYVNNLHHGKHPEIYEAIEKLVDISIPAWDHVLHGRASSGRGTQQSRFSHPGEGTFEGPVERDDYGYWEPLDEERLARHERENGDIALDEYRLHELELDYGEAEPEVRQLEMRKAKWEEIREYMLPEPDDFQPATYGCGESIRERFRDSGLQVVVKMASIELTPEKPEFPAGSWHVRTHLAKPPPVSAHILIPDDGIFNKY
jgi:hypothetical protein